MFNNYKIVTISPSGRKKYVEILNLYLLKNRNVIDKHVWWINTGNYDDVIYLKKLCETYPDFYELNISEKIINEVTPELVSKHGFRSIEKLFLNCTDASTIYIRLDDDICYISDNCIVELIKCRLRNPQAFLIMPLILNNSLGCNPLFENKIFDFKIKNRGDIWNLETFFCDICQCDHFGFLSGKSAEISHKEFFEKADSMFNNLKLSDFWHDQNERHSVNCICWFGHDFQSFNGNVHNPEEIWLTQIKTQELNRNICYCGKSFMVHFAFHSQRKYLEENTNYLKLYKNLAIKKFL